MPGRPWLRRKWARWAARRAGWPSATASSLILPAWYCGSDELMLSKNTSTCRPSGRPARAQCLCTARGPCGAGQRHEHAGGEVRSRAVALRGVTHLARIRFFEEGDEFGHVLRRGSSGARPARWAPSPAPSSARHFTGSKVMRLVQGVVDRDRAGRGRQERCCRRDFGARENRRGCCRPRRTCSRR